MKKLTYEYVKSHFEENGCELLEQEYMGVLNPMQYKCICGGVSMISFNNFKAGKRCWECRSNKIANKLKLNFKGVYDYFKENNCELLEKEYINCNTKMKYKCECDSIKYITLHNFKNGQRCHKCAVKKRSGTNNYKWIEDRKQAKDNLRFRKKCGGILKRTLIKTSQKKIDKTYELLGYSVNDLQKHIYNHFNWENIKNKKWHLDHIFPIKAFLDYNIKDMKLINSLDNLQPLLSIENLNKNAKYNKEEFENWLKEKKYDF